jgi:hypothetical protein
VITPDLRRHAARGTHADTAVIVRFADGGSAALTSRRRARDNRLLVALGAGRAQSHRHRASEQGRGRVGAWIINGISATFCGP